MLEIGALTMPSKNVEKLSRKFFYRGQEVVIVRPGITLALYSYADLATVMAAAADALMAYLDFVPSKAIGAQYVAGPDEYTPGRWEPFHAGQRSQLLEDLRSGIRSPDDDGYGFMLTETLDGQAGDYGATLGGIDFSASDDEEDGSDDGSSNETSILRFDLPWNILDAVDVERLVEFTERIASLFPFFTGNAGMSFNHTVAYVPEAMKEINNLLPRFLGFDPACNSVQLGMRHKAPPAHWLNFADDELVASLGGEASLRAELHDCEVRSIKDGLIIRSAKFPPVGDINQGAQDLGCLPTVARALKPIRFNEPSFLGFSDVEFAGAWLERFDDLAGRDWNNG